LKKKQEAKVGDLVKDNYAPEVQRDFADPMGLVIQVEKKFYRHAGAYGSFQDRLRIYWLTGSRKSTTSVESSSWIMVLQEKKE